MWFRYKCYLDGKYSFSGIIYALEYKDVVENVNTAWGEKYEVRKIEKVE